MSWQEKKITGFLGISTKRKPQINECADCNNIELRDTNGDMLSAVNPTLFLAAPDFSSQGFTLVAHLGFTTHVFSQLGGVQKEVTFYLQRGTVGGYPHIAIGMNPWYYPLSGGWSDNWRWLNKIVVTTVSATHGTYGLHLTSDPSGEDNYFGAIYNITKGVWAGITNTVAGTPGVVYTTNDVTSPSWAGDTVIFMRNYEPFGVAGAYYTAKSAIVTTDISFHRVLNELRIGFGSVANRLAIGVGYKKKYFQIDTLASGDTLTNVTNLDNIILDPYNIISDIGTFGLTAQAGTNIGGAYTPFPSTVAYLFFKMTAILDDLNEYVVVDDLGYPFVCSGEIALKPTIRFATMNKRVTRIRIWCSANASITRLEDYRLIKEIDVAKSTALVSPAVLWTLDSTGTLVLSAKTGEVNSSGEFQLDYTAYVQGESLSNALGYTPTIDYIKSWDQALVADAHVYLLNPYDSRTWKNFIFNSPINGAGASMYDVITGGDYKSLDTKDGNDIVGIELNSNLDFVILRNNGYQQYDPVRQVPSQIMSGVGVASTRLGIVNQNGAIFFPSQFDYYILQGNKNLNLSKDTIRDAYRSLTKSNILGSKENYGGSIVFYAPTEMKWYIFIPDKGWTLTDIAVPVYFGNSFDGSLMFLSSVGVIYKINPLQNVHTATQVVTWTSVPMDIALLGEEITSDDRFIVGSIWMKYASSKAITMQISYDGGVFGSDRTFPITQTPLTSGALVVGQKYIINNYVSDDNFVNVGVVSNTTGVEFIAASTPPTHWQHSSALTPITMSTLERRFTPGRNCKSFQVKLTYTMASGDVRTRISAIGIRWQIFKTGLFR